MPFVYIVRCADGSLYTGYAEDVDRRVAAHNAGTGARYTAGRRPVRLVFSEACASRGAALRREHALKGLTRVEKEAVIAAGRRATRAGRRTTATPRGSMGAVASTGTRDQVPREQRLAAPATGQSRTTAPRRSRRPDA